MSTPITPPCKDERLFAAWLTFSGRIATAHDMSDVREAGAQLREQLRRVKGMEKS